MFFLLLSSPVVAGEVSNQESVPKSSDRSFIKDSAVINYFLWGGRILYVRNKDSKIFNTSLKKWGSNITKPELDDGDSFATNYLYHPYFGALYYQVYRDLGYEKHDAYLGTILQSTLWEFTIEGTVEKPSIIDLIVTPGLGIPLGLYFEKLNKQLSNSDSFFAKTASYLINPTRLFLKEGDLGIANPLSGTFMIYKPFKYRDMRHDISPLSLSGVSMDTYFFDVKQYRGGGTDILYLLETSFVDSSNEMNLSIRFPWAGAYDGNDKEYGVVDNGFEIGNMSVAFSKILEKEELFYLGSSLDVNFASSSIWGDKKDRLEKLHANSLILKDVLHDSTVISPSLYFANSIIFLEVGSEFYINANDYSNEAKEFFAVYKAKFKVFKSKNNKHNLDLDFKAIDKITESSPGLDAYAEIGFKFVDNLIWAISFIKPVNGEAAKYIHNGVNVSIKVPLN